MVWTLSQLHNLYVCTVRASRKSIERLFWQKLFLCLYAWMALMPSFTATRFAVFNTLYIKLHDSNHWWSQCQNITGIHRYSAAHSLCSGGWFRAVFQPCAACGSTIVSKRLQSALHAGAEALIQTANAPVSHRSLWMGRGRSGFMDLTQPCGASKATGALQRTAEMKPWVAVPQRTFIYKGIEGQDGVLHLPHLLMNECTIIQYFCMAQRLAYYTYWLLQHLLCHEYDIFKWCTNKLCTNLAFNFTTVTRKAANSPFNTFKSSPK